MNLTVHIFPEIGCIRINASGKTTAEYDGVADQEGNTPVSEQFILRKAAGLADSCRRIVFFFFRLSAAGSSDAFPLLPDDVPIYNGICELSSLWFCGRDSHFYPDRWRIWPPGRPGGGLRCSCKQLLLRPRAVRSHCEEDARPEISGRLLRRFLRLTWLLPPPLPISRPVRVHSFFSEGRRLRRRRRALT